MSAPFGATLLVAQAVLGWNLGHHRPSGPGCCDACGVETAAVFAQMARLQTCPSWRARDNAAHDLRKFDWHCHPEAVEALATALLRDCHEEVREEAAESLAKMAPCLPAAHEALQRAANCDPDHATRKEARKGLKALAHRCEAACAVCGPALPVAAEPPLLPGALPPAAVVPPVVIPPAEVSPPVLPPPIAAPSPFAPAELEPVPGSTTLVRPGPIGADLPLPPPPPPVPYVPDRD